MTRWPYFAILFLALACAHNQKKGSTPPEPNKAVEKPADLAQNEAVALSDDFRVPLAEWAKKNPRANYARLSKETQKLIKTHGVLYYANIKNLSERDDRYQYLTLDDGTKVLFDTQKGSDGPCGEFYIPLSVVGFTEGLPTFLTSMGPKILPANSRLKFEKTLIRKPGETTAKTFYVPSSEVPWNISSDGKYVAWKYEVKMSLVENWWKHLARRFRDLREELPFVLIRITPDGFTVETSERALIPGQYEQVPVDLEGYIRYSYKPRGLTADISAGCH